MNALRRCFRRGSPFASADWTAGRRRNWESSPRYAHAGDRRKNHKRANNIPIFPTAPLFGGWHLYFSGGWHLYFASVCENPHGQISNSFAVIFGKTPTQSFLGVPIEKSKRGVLWRHSGRTRSPASQVFQKRFFNYGKETGTPTRSVWYNSESDGQARIPGEKCRRKQGCPLIGPTAIWLFLGQDFKPSLRSAIMTGMEIPEPKRRCARTRWCVARVKNRSIRNLFIMFYRILSAPPGYAAHEKFMVAKYNTPQADSCCGDVRNADGSRFFPTLEDARRAIPGDAREVPFEPEYQSLELWESECITEDLDTIRISGVTVQEFFRVRNQIVPGLPAEIKKRFLEIEKSYFGRFGLHGIFERMNDRSLSQIFAEFQPGKQKPIASGEKEGLKWSLWDGKAANDPENEKRQES